MSEEHKSWAEKDLENKIEQNQDDPNRQLLLEKAKVFKSGWVELAQVLSQIAKSKEYEAWGYKTLETYCLKELHIRKNTVAKLIGNYRFLTKREPEMLKQEQLGRLPDIETLNVLAKASETQMGDERYTQLKEGALDKGYSAATIYKKMKDTTTQPEEKNIIIKKRIASLAHSLRLLIAEEGAVPETITNALEAIEIFAQD